MDSAQCGLAEKEAKSFAGETLGTDSGSEKTTSFLCQEYLLQSEQVIYRIRPRDEKHSALLSVGGRNSAWFCPLIWALSANSDKNISNDAGGVKEWMSCFFL